ncbi:hypothetical protein D3C73_1386200 [compost metagenome]
MAIEPVVVAATVQRRAGHVEVDHVFGAALDGGHGKPAGVRKKVQHAFALGVGAYPIATVAHVEKQPCVLFAAQVDPIMQATLGDGHVLDHVPDQPLGGALQQVAMLQRQGMRARLRPLH